MKFRCLVLDHDDTVVDSTSEIHYPSFIAYARKYHPEAAHYTLREYFEYNFVPGVLEFFRDVVGLTEKEMKEEELFWKAYAEQHVPTAYPGMKELIARFRDEGGKICVVSHSFQSMILRDYAENGLPEPDMVFGWDLPREKRKPDPYALHVIMDEYGFSPSELIVVDDLKPGYEMARRAGVPFAASGWANDIPMIEEFMRKNCDYYCKTIADLEQLLFF